MVNYELIPMGQIITVGLYSQQLEHVQQALKPMEWALVNSKSVLFLYDDARPHVARVTRDTIHQLSCGGHCVNRLQTSSIPWITTFMGNPLQISQTCSRYISNRFCITIGITFRINSVSNLLYICFSSNKIKNSKDFFGYLVIWKKKKKKL